MSDELVVQCCAPTLAGLKTGSMFSCDFKTEDELRRDIRRLNRMLAPRGLRVIPLRVHGQKALLYVFRPACLKKDFQNRETQELLNRCGYEGLCCEQCLSRLMKRLRESEEFPHEIGLFLSYPPEDVRGFMENRAQNYKFTGYWKVYGNEDNARRTFDRYKKCTDTYCRSLKSGVTLSELAVAV